MLRRNCFRQVSESIARHQQFDRQQIEKPFSFFRKLVYSRVNLLEDHVPKFMRDRKSLPRARLFGAEHDLKAAARLS